MKMLDEKEINMDREYGCTGRIERLRNRIASARPHISSRRALIVTKAYQDYENEHIYMKRARSFYNIMEQLDVHIMEDELIVGHQAKEHRSGQVFPEYRLDFIINELDTFETRPNDKFIVSEQAKEDLRGIADYWKGRTLYERGTALLPQRVLDHVKATHPVFIGDVAMEVGMGHICPDFEKILKVGFRGIKDECQTVIDSMDLTQPDAIRKFTFLKAVDLTCDGIILFANRYAAEAERLAAMETNAQRKAELQEIARICGKVPEHPAETFWEALQSIWFVQLAIQLESNGVSISPGRVDQYVYPYYSYSRDHQPGLDLQELLEAFWLKFTEMVMVKDSRSAEITASHPMGQNIVVGGIDTKGRDATNELSYMLLDAQLHLRMPQPNFGARVHSASPTEFLTAVARTIRDANTMPQIDNDEVYIPALMERGYTLAEARDYCLEGCNEPGLPGKLHGRGNGGFVNQAKCLELALNDGRCMLTGEQLGPHTGIFDDATTFEDVFEAYRRQVEYFAYVNVIAQNTADVAHRLYAPVPFLSSTMDVLQEGKDVLDGGCKYNFTGPFIIGVGTTGNALSALKDVVFDQKRYTIGQVQEALSKNFEGYDLMRKELQNSPKWCNDAEGVDSITSAAFDVVAAEMRNYTNERGGPYIVSCLPMSTIVSFGHDVAATPDGRLRDVPLSDSIGAQAGTDLSGPTASMISACRLNHTEMAGGLIFNMRLSPDSIAGERLQSFVALIRTFIRLKGMEIQFNIVDSSVLKKAKADPAKYQGLTVRVAGYSAFFVDLAEDIQDEIIERIEHSL